MVYQKRTGLCKLTVTDAGEKDDGEYRVEAVNPFGETKSSAVMTVICKYIVQDQMFMDVN